MFRSLSIPVVLAVAAIGAAVVSAPAQAQHHGSHFHGHHHHGIAGERQIARAVSEIDLAYHDVLFSHRRSHVLTAMHQISAAYAVVRNPVSRQEMSDAYEHLELFLHSNTDRDLELASAHLETARDVLRPVVVRRPPMPRVPPPVVHHPPVIVTPPPVYHGGGISLGNDRFQFRIGF
ncbi:MAG TPA: hypothetical protein VGN57_14545 [Pirellulaceae bacterium]|jgi:hypothetical protein|nr:hypothetical protein [Pirellulaceae bacterium]